MRASYLILIFIVLFCAQSTFSQVQNEPIVIKRKGVYAQNGKILKYSELADKLGTNSISKESWLKASKNYTPSIILGAAGGALIGWPLGTLVGGGDPSWALAGIGAGLVGLSIPLSSAYSRHSAAAVEAYNTGLDMSEGPRILIGTGDGGLSLVLIF